LLSTAQSDDQIKPIDRLTSYRRQGSASHPGCVWPARGDKSQKRDQPRPILEVMSNCRENRVPFYQSLVIPGSLSNVLSPSEKDGTEAFDLTARITEALRAIVRPKSVSRAPFKEKVPCSPARLETKAYGGLSDELEHSKFVIPTVGTAQSRRG